MNELKFDEEIHSNFEDIAIIDYGIVEGNNTIVFIKQDRMDLYMDIKINI